MVLGLLAAARQGDVTEGLLLLEFVSLMDGNKCSVHNSGIWSLVKRAPQATKKRMTFEVPGPAVEGAVPLDDRARQIFRYFKRYNYTVKETGEVITFEGIYAADKGQAAALVFYLFCGGCQPRLGH